jgi:hypothetical protein
MPGAENFEPVRKMTRCVGNGVLRPGLPRCQSISTFEWSPWRGGSKKHSPDPRALQHVHLCPWRKGWPINQKN